MKKFLFFLLTCCISYFSSNAQTATIKGNVLDTLNKQALSNAVVALLKPKDSVLIKFTRTQTNGDFAIKAVPAGNYLLMISYPSFADYGYAITVKENADEDAGFIKMTLKSKLLEEVLVRQKIAAIRLKGDT